jgi:type II secretory pathway pseudopilin PulG
MINTHRSIGRVRSSTSAGFSLVEVMVSVGIMTLIMAATMSALAQTMKANETAVLVTAMNSSLRTGMDLMMRDLLQVGSGLPPGHFVLIPSGAGERINLPGPPGTAYMSVAGDVDLNAVNPGPGLGPLVNMVAATTCTTEGSTCVKTDMITTLAADSTFTHVALTARAANGTTITVDPAVNILSGPDRVVKGQLIMLEKGSYAVLVQVTADPIGQVITFATNDSLKLNVHNAIAGSAAALSAFAPSPDTAPVLPATVLATVATRIRMISYYIDNTNPAHPKLVRRINNGNPTTFDNTSGSTVAFDIDNLQITYDIADGSLVPPTSQDCLPGTCSLNQIRKVNVTLSARSRSVFGSTRQYFRNSLSTQVSLRGMAFVNEYVQ